MKFVCLNLDDPNFTHGGIYEGYITNDNICIGGELYERDRLVPLIRPFYGDEILKMIREGQIQNDTYFKSLDGKSEYRYKDNSLTGQGGGFNVIYFIKDSYIIKEYMTFDEARFKAQTENKPFKHKDIPDWNNIQCIFSWLGENKTSYRINNMLNEKSWEVQD